MYTEIKETVNFLARYLFGRIPRRKVCLFAESLANCLAYRALESQWVPTEPNTDEARRVLQVKFGPAGQTDQQIIMCAAAVGIEVDEVKQLLPTGFLLYMNPGQVFYRVGDPKASAVPVWMGSTNVDAEYSLMPDYAAQTTESVRDSQTGKTYFIGKATAKAAGDSVVEENDQFVPLQLETPDADMIKSGELRPDQRVFVFTPQEHITYLVEQFAVTRFGSHRQRPDHEHMKRIQKQAAFKTLVSPVVDDDEDETESVRMRAQSTTPQPPAEDADALASLTQEQISALMNLVKHIGTVNPTERRPSMEDGLLEAIHQMRMSNSKPGHQQAPHPPQFRGEQQEKVYPSMSAASTQITPSSEYSSYAGQDYNHSFSTFRSGYEEDTKWADPTKWTDRWGHNLH